MFYPLEQYPATGLLAAHFDVIRDEFQALHARHFVPWPERWLYGRGWSVYGFYQNGLPIEQGCQSCPQTAAVLAQIPGLKAAGFSRLAADTPFSPTVAGRKPRLRCHLGIQIPAGDVAIRVGDDTRGWQEGQCLLFDDTEEHEAWNRGEIDRIVLLVDIPR